MVKLTLLLKATMDNITNLQPQAENHEFQFKIQCSSCHESHPNTVAINQQEEHEISGSRGSASFVWRCSFCKQESTLSFLPLVIPSDLPGSSKGKKAKGGATPTSTAPRPIVESETWTPFLTVECRGLETVGFEWEGQWKADVPESDAKFDSIEFEEGRWDEYDEGSELPVSVEDLESKWVKV